MFSFVFFLFSLFSMKSNFFLKIINKTKYSSDSLFFITLIFLCSLLIHLFDPPVTIFRFDLRFQFLPTRERRKAYTHTRQQMTNHRRDFRRCIMVLINVYSSFFFASFVKLEKNSLVKKQTREELRRY